MEVYTSFICFSGIKQFSFHLEDSLKVTSLDIWMHRCHLFCHNQAIYIEEYIQVTKHWDALHLSYSESLFLDVVKQNLLFFLSGFSFTNIFISIFMFIYLFIFFLRLPLAWQTFRHWPGYCSPLCKTGSQTRTGNLWFLNASRQPLSYALCRICSLYTWTSGCCC